MMYKLTLSLDGLKRTTALQIESSREFTFTTPEHPAAALVKSIVHKKYHRKRKK